METDGPVAGRFECESRSDGEIVLEHRAQIAEGEVVGEVGIQPNHRRGSIHIVLAGKIRLIDRFALLRDNVFR